MADEAIEDISASEFATRPNDLKHLRACTSCHLVKCLTQFLEEFCDNCWRDWAGGDLPSSIGRKDAFDIANERTTTDFEGLVSMMRPKGSWVARWLRLHKKVGEDGEQRMLLPGVYAISLPGEVQAARAMGDDEDYEDDVADDAAAVEDGADEEES